MSKFVILEVLFWVGKTSKDFILKAIDNKS